MKKLLSLAFLMAFNFSTQASTVCHIKITESSERLETQEKLIEIKISQDSRSMKTYVNQQLYANGQNAGYLKNIESSSIFGDRRIALELHFKNGKPLRGGVSQIILGARQDIVSKRILCTRFAN